MIVFVLPQKMNRLELTLQVNCGPHFFSQKLRKLLIRSCFYRFEVGGRYDKNLLIRSCFWFQAISCMQVLEVVCGLRHFFSGKQESKEPFFLKSLHHRPLKSTEVGEGMLESSNSKLFLVTCYIALGCVFFSKYHLSETFIFVE